MLVFLRRLQPTQDQSRDNCWLLVPMNVHKMNKDTRRETNAGGDASRIFNDDIVNNTAGQRNSARQLASRFVIISNIRAVNVQFICYVQPTTAVISSQKE